MRARPSGWLLAARIAAFGVLAFLILPAFIVVPVSFTDTDYLSLPQDHLSLSHWQTLFQTPMWRNSLVQSFAVAVASTLLSALFGSLAAVGFMRMKPSMAAKLRLVLLLPLIVPTIVAGLAWYWVYIPLRLLDTYFGVILAHTVAGIPLVFVTASSALAAFDPRLEQAARSMGAGQVRVLRQVILPFAMPGILSGAVFAFIASWDEVVVLLFITSRNVYLLPRAIWDGINDNVDPAVAAAATLMISVTVGILLLQQLLSRRENGKAS